MAREAATDSFRMSFSVTEEQRRDIRIAAALHNQNPNEWAAEILARAAEKATAGVKVKA